PARREAAARAAANKARWPTCTPSKLPTATAPRESFLTALNRPGWMRIRAPDKGSVSTLSTRCFQERCMRRLQASGLRLQTGGCAAPPPRARPRSEARGLGPLAAALLLSLPAGAAEIRFDGAYQLRLNLNSNYLLDPGQRLGQTAWAEHRLRLTPKIVEPERIEIQAQFDVVSGLIAGDLAPGFGALGWTE